MKREYTVRPVRWDSHDAQLLRMIRLRVFVDEQKVPVELEIDEIDPTAYHVLAETADGQPAGTGRLFPDSTDSASAKIGRMAVLSEFRATGCGVAILQSLIDEARRNGYRQIILTAQVQAIPFYERAGFHAEGDEFLDAGIPHRWMRLKL